MRQISEARRQRALSLSERLKEIASARVKLPAELDNIGAQERAVLLERNILHNLDAATSDIPDELLAMIFEADENMPLTWQRHNPHFGVLVSHVSHRWRSIALSTPRLWARVRYMAGKRNPVELFSLYLSRSKMAPVDIHISAFGYSALGTELYHSFADHVGHCHRLCIENVAGETLQQLLKCISNQPAPILTFLKMHSSNELHSLSGPLFALTAPSLRVLHIHELELNTIHLSVFEGITQLRLTDIIIEQSETYIAFRSILGEMKSLLHFELQLFGYPIPLPPQSPLELPSLQFLHVDFSGWPEGLNMIIHNIRASSLSSLSLGWLNNEDSFNQDSLRLARSHFPSLRHLTLPGAISGPLSKIHLLAEAFPHIERLTCILGKPFHDIFAAIGNCTTLAWPKLESIAVAAMDSYIDLELRNAVLNLQHAGRPFHMLMLPQEYISGEETEVLAELREVVEIEPFIDDWPRPFENIF